MPSRRAPSSTRHRKKPDPLALQVGERVRKLRTEGERGFTFDAFVEETGLGRGYISELERGLVVPTVHALEKLARALGVTMADLVAGDSPRERVFLKARSLTGEAVQEILENVERLLGEGIPPGKG
jgi:transcriptional regulator with XRE-family HTH domain